MGRFADPRPRIGQHIRAARLRRAMTQAQLASRLGIPYQQIQRYERGRTLTLDRLVTIAEELRIDPVILLNGSEPK